MDENASRRGFLKGAVVLSSTLLTALDPADAKEYHGEIPWQPGETDAPPSIDLNGFIYFTPVEIEFLNAAVSRLIPADDVGPGALELGAVTFLDRQMAGSYGKAERWYMSGPFDENAPADLGYQTHRTPAELYRAAIKAIDDYLAQKAPNKPFAQLSGEDQDKFLAAMEKGNIELGSVRSIDFFDLLLQNTIEGFFCDPIYGGNKDMASWKMIGFPGARYDYRPYVDKHNQRIDLTPVGVKGGQSFQSVKS